jgi:glucose-6-phosphate isomerase
MESNGKRVAIDGTILPFTAGEINFGEPGSRRLSLNNMNILDNVRIT